MQSPLNAFTIGLECAATSPMRVVVVMLLAGLLAQTPQDVTVLEGRLFHQGSSAPIANATIALTRFNPEMPDTLEAMRLAQSVGMLLRSPRNTSPIFIDAFLLPSAELAGVSPDLARPVSQTTIKTDDSGRFSFKDLLPGKYSLTAEAPGYFGPRFVDESGATLYRIVTIEPRQKPSPVELSMMRAGYISGRIRTPNGEPAVGVGVVGYQSIYPLGRPSWNSEGRTTTNDRGEFRLGPLAPGEWFVGATNTILPTGVRAVLPPGIAPTYFPGVMDPVQASPVVVGDDQTYAAIDFELRSETSPTYKISGTITNKATPPPNSRSTVSLYLVPQNPSLVDNLDIPAITVAPLDFQLTNVKPGAYELYATTRDGLGRTASTGRTTVTVRDADITAVSVTIADGGTLDAQILVENAQAIQRERVSVRLNSADSQPNVITTQLASVRSNADGKLTASNLPMGRYSLNVLGLPQGAYVSDIRQSGQSVYNTGVEIGGTPNPAQITVALDGATISGVVQTDDRKPAATAHVILVPPEARRNNPMAYKTAMTDDAGRFSFTGVMPSAYTIFALKSRPYRQPWLNPAFLARYVDRARLVSVGTRGTAEVRLPLVPN